MQALLIIDLQKDFLPGGSMAVEGGNQIIPKINQLMEDFSLILASKDWHPEDHVSFAKTHNKSVGEIIRAVGGVEQILWPQHCVQNTEGAEFPEQFNGRFVDKIFYKGIQPDVDSYSAFFDNAKMSSTGLYEYLKNQGIKKIFICGLATDYCVKNSVLDALELGLQVEVFQGACMAINRQEGDEKKALQEMEKKGAIIRK